MFDMRYFQTPDCSGDVMFEMTSATSAAGGNCNKHPVNGASYKFIFDGTCPESKRLLIFYFCMNLCHYDQGFFWGFT